VPPDLKAWVDSLHQRGILGVLLIAISVVTVLGLLQDTSGVVVDWWSDLLRRLFGWGSYVVVAVGACVGVLLLARKMPGPKSSRWHVVVGLVIVYLALLGLVHLISANQEPWQAAGVGRGGGYIGALLSAVLNEYIGLAPTALVLGLVLGWGLITVSGRSFAEWADRTEEGFYRARTWLGRTLIDLSSRRPFGSEDRSNGPDAEPVVVWGGAEGSARTAPLGVDIRASKTATPRVAPAGTDPSDEAVSKRRRAGRQAKIIYPTLELLEEPDEAAFDETDLQLKAQVIEETLASFGVPAKVVEINWGPRVTQFGVEPGYIIRRGHSGEETERKIRVAKIASLGNDLALALAAAPVRIEAPVPGRSIVGIEVPNSRVSTVSLRSVMASSVFRRGKSRLRLALGEGVAGSPIVADLARMPHLLIAGATGTGKSVCINAIATCLLLQNSPFTLRLVMIDPKRVELLGYTGVPHLFGQVESASERVVGVLRWLVRVMEQRYQRLAEAGSRHIDDYNRHWRVGSKEYLPRIVVLLDELADLMFFAPDEVEHSIIRLAQMARATGIHLVIATQRPSVDVVTGLIKANFPARLGFAVTSNTDSRVILDGVGAETLLGKGDLLFMSPDASGLVRIQGSWVSDAEVTRVVQHWKTWYVEQEPVLYVEGIEEPFPATGEGPWEQTLAAPVEEERDELLKQAIEIVQAQGGASASLLQRRMHIGYPRASRLIDTMHEMGIVGPPESGGRPRQVLTLTGGPAEPAASTDRSNGGSRRKNRSGNRSGRP
jgi:S-DNA-T family DNA segregation ATPase FtsK/SpoIIIE